MKDISRCLFLVDGITEIRAFREKFRKEYSIQPNLRKVDCNGKDVSPEGYASHAFPIIQLGWKDIFNTFLCVIDLESRPISPERFARNLLRVFNRRLTEAKIKAELIIAVPNQMFENWIVSDLVGLKDKTEFIKPDVVQEQFDGQSGTTVLKRSMTVSYRKSSHGWELFKMTEFDTSKKNSLSFRLFAEILEI
ncbi:MAG: hypothetical protein P9X24_17495 [Candidatus Hatepunaea meridiana]|nr:hypothetical protein [Candidatus Hatepunaea meridiana]